MHDAQTLGNINTHKNLVVYLLSLMEWNNNIFYRNLVQIESFKKQNFHLNENTAAVFQIFHIHTCPLLHEKWLLCKKLF